MELSETQEVCIQLLKECGANKTMIIAIMLMLKDDIRAQRGLAIWLYDNRPTAEEVSEIWVRNYIRAHPQNIQIEGQDEKLEE